MKGKKLIVVNLIGGPGLGKSILAADLFSALKKRYIVCDVSWEYIKKKLREKALKAVQSQIYIFGKQQFQLYSLKGEVDVAITDSPILLNCIYDKTHSKPLRELVLDEFEKYDNMVYRIERDPSQPYETEGRYQDEDGAKEVDKWVVDFMEQNKIKYKNVIGIGPDTLETIVNDVVEKLKQNETKN